MFAGSEIYPETPGSWRENHFLNGAAIKSFDDAGLVAKVSRDISENAGAGCASMERALPICFFSEDAGFHGDNTHVLPVGT